MSGNPTADADSVTTAETPDELVETGLVPATSPNGEVAKTEQTTATVTVGSQAPPKFIPPNFERMPPELKALKNWLLWAPVWTGTKWTKRPIQPSGFGASTTKQKHWSTFDEVKQTYERALTVC